MKKDNFRNSIIKWFGWLLISISFSVFCSQMIIPEYYTLINVLITLIISFIFGLFLVINTWDENFKFIKGQKPISFLIFMASIAFMISSYKLKGIECAKKLSNVLPVNLFCLGWYIISVIGIIYITILLYRVINDILKEIFFDLDKQDKKIYMIVSISFSVIIAFVYIINTKWFLQYDNVYSMDSGFCLNNIFANPMYYDVRHPLLGVITFPIWAVINLIFKIIAPANLIPILTAIIIQWLNIQLLLLVGLMLKKLTNSREVFWIYLCSFPTLIYSLSLEKYQLCTFLTVFYVYTLCNKKSGSIGALILSIGVMPTNVVLGFLEVFNKYKLKERVNRIFKLFVGGLLTIICLGKVFLLNLPATMESVSLMHDTFSGHLLMKEKFFSVLSMIQNSFVALSSTAGEKYLWSNIMAGVNILEIIIMILIFIGFVVKFKNQFTKICLFWLSFAFFLFMVLNWAPKDSPLFTILFSWAIIPLVTYGLNFVIEKIKFNKKSVYVVLSITMLLINITSLIDINVFLSGR